MDTIPRSKKSYRNFISVESALDRLFSSINKPNTNKKKTEYLYLIESNGRVLAEDLHSGTDVPSFDRSDRDGFAIFSSDTGNASYQSPIYLKIIGKGLAGQQATLRHLRKRQALEIATGAKLPKGADSVIMFEDTTSEDNRLVKISKPVNRGDHISRKGSDVRKKQLVLKKGTWLTPQDVALIASLGLDMISVVKKPMVGIGFSIL